MMIRQTFIRALIKSNLIGGATNSSLDKNEVSFTIIGNGAQIENLLNRLQSLKELNSWGAKVDELVLLDKMIAIEDHQVTTSNVDDFKWSEGVAFYL